MKRKFQYKIISFAMVLVMLSYVIYGTTTMLYFFSNQDAISKELCVQKENQQGCNGKCYLSKLLSKSKTSNKKEVPNRNAEEDFRLTINLDLPTKELSLATFRCIDLLKITDLNKYRLLVAYNTIEVPPPKIV